MSLKLSSYSQFQETPDKTYSSKFKARIAKNVAKATTNELQFQEAENTPHKLQSKLHRMSEAMWGSPVRTEATKTKAKDMESNEVVKRMKLEEKDDQEHNEEDEGLTEEDYNSDWNTKLSEHIESLEN